MQINPNPTVGSMPLPPATPGSGTSGTFFSLLRDSIGDVNDQQLYSENIIQRVAAGEEIPDAVVATAVNKAEIAFRTLIQIRNKLTDAFNELRELQI